MQKKYRLAVRSAKIGKNKGSGKGETDMFARVIKVATAVLFSLAFWTCLSFILAVVTLLLCREVHQVKAEKENYAAEAVRNFIGEHAQELSRKESCAKPAPIKAEPVREIAPTPIVAFAPSPIQKFSKLSAVSVHDHGVYFFPYLGEEFTEVLTEFKTKRFDLTVTLCQPSHFAGRTLGYHVQTQKRQQQR